MIPKLNKPPEPGPYIVRHTIADEYLRDSNIYTQGEIMDLCWREINLGLAKKLSEFFGHGMYCFKVDFFEDKVSDKWGYFQTELSGNMTVTKVERQVLTYFDPQYDKMPDAKLFRTAMDELQNRVRGKVSIWKWNFKEMVNEFRRRYVKYEPVVAAWLDLHNPF